MNISIAFLLFSLHAISAQGSGLSPSTKSPHEGLESEFLRLLKTKQIRLNVSVSFIQHLDDNRLTFENRDTSLRKVVHYEFLKKETSEETHNATHEELYNYLVGSLASSDKFKYRNHVLHLNDDVRKEVVTFILETLYPQEDPKNYFARFMEDELKIPNFKYPNNKTLEVFVDDTKQRKEELISRKNYFLNRLPQWAGGVAALTEKELSELQTLQEILRKIPFVRDVLKHLLLV